MFDGGSLFDPDPGGLPDGPGVRMAFHCILRRYRVVYWNLDMADVTTELLAQMRAQRLDPQIRDMGMSGWPKVTRRIGLPGGLREEG